MAGDGDGVGYPCLEAAIGVQLAGPHHIGDNSVFGCARCGGLFAHGGLFHRHTGGEGMRCQGGDGQQGQDHHYGQQ